MPIAFEKKYYDLIAPKFLDWDFIEPYTTKQPPFGVLGAVTYLRTYSRFVPELARRERWWEACLRVVEYSMGLFPTRPRCPEFYNLDNLKEEARELFDMMFNMQVFPSGRTLFVGGANVPDGTGHFNCSFCTVHEIKSFVDSFFLLLHGCGVGFSVEREYVDQLPEFKFQGKLFATPYTPVPKGSRLENSIGRFLPDGSYEIVVGDSRQGWTEALDMFLHALTTDTGKHGCIFIDYSNVRPEGERLKTFGGRASGHKPLQLMFERIFEICTTKRKLSGVDAMDVQNAIAAAVVVGGVRRSSEIAFGDYDDSEFVEAKLNLWTDPAKEKWRDTRVLSNNSVALWHKPTFEELKVIFDRIRNNGEPGLSIAANAAKRRPNYRGSNPCHEILLDHQGVCNLTTINMVSFVDDEGNFNEAAFRRALYHAVRMGSRITLVRMWDEDWDYIQKRDRLLGVSLTGQVEAWNKMGLKFNDPKIIKILRDARAYARKVADDYHELLNIPKALLITTTKPEGTLSQLPTVSSGVHAPYAPYYLRRIRISKADPIAKALRDIGIEPQPENNQGKDLDDEKCTTWVFTFPVKTDAKIRAIDESAIEQLERYKMMMDNYIDHTCSITVTVADHEWDEVVKWVYNNWDSCIGIAFLPRFDPSEPGNMYPQMPYETCSKETYEALKAEIGDLDEESLIAFISTFETDYEEFELEAGCSTGTCPVR